MAKEWYLLNSPYDQLSGYESDAIVDFGEEGFLEALESELAVNVEICNFDLSECISQKVIIQNNHQDTKLKTLSRMMFAKIGTCKAGMYVKYKNRYWLIVGLVDDNKVCEKAVLLICNYKISWIDNNGEIIQRWVNAESASQYNNGETGMTYYFVRSDQLMVYMPDDPYSLMLNTGKRFIVDKRCQVYELDFEEGITKDTSNPVIVYDVTRSDTVLDNYIDSGIVGFIFTQVEQRENDGYYVVDGVGYWLCDVPTERSEAKQLSCQIVGSPYVYIDLEPEIYTAVFYDQDGNEVKEDLPDFEFNINYDFVDSPMDIQFVNRSVLISTSNYKLNNKSFDIVLTADGYEPVSKTITIREFI